MAKYFVELVILSNLLSQSYIFDLRNLILKQRGVLEIDILIKILSIIKLNITINNKSVWPFCVHILLKSSASHFNRSKTN